MAPGVRVIRIVHHVSGRTRLRLPWLRERPEEAEPLADCLAGLHPSMEATIRPWTGSVLCTYEPDVLDASRIVRTVQRHTGVAIVLQADERHPEVQSHVEHAARQGASTLRRKVTAAFRELNGEVLEATEGRLDLGALTGIGFIGVGALEILSSRAAPAPPWFNMAWWAYRTFTLSGAETRAESDDEPAEAAADDLGDAPLEE